MKTVKLYPTKSNMGGELASEGWNVPEKLVPMFLSRGYEKEISTNNPKASVEILELARKAQEEVFIQNEKMKAEKSDLEIQREALEKEKEAFFALKNGAKKGKEI